MDRPGEPVADLRRERRTAARRRHRRVARRGAAPSGAGAVPSRAQVLRDARADPSARPQGRRGPRTRRCRAAGGRAIGQTITVGAAPARASASAAASSSASSARAPRAAEALRVGGVVDRERPRRPRARRSSLPKLAPDCPTRERVDRPYAPLSSTTTVTFKPSCTAVTSSVAPIRYVPSPITTKTSPPRPRACGCRAPPGSRGPCRRRRTRGAHAARRHRHSLSRSPGGQPAAATTQSPARAAR